MLLSLSLSLFLFLLRSSLCLPYSNVSYFYISFLHAHAHTHASTLCTTHTHNFPQAIPRRIELEKSRNVRMKKGRSNKSATHRPAGQRTDRGLLVAKEDPMRQQHAERMRFTDAPIDARTYLKNSSATLLRLRCGQGSPSPILRAVRFAPTSTNTWSFVFISTLKISASVSEPPSNNTLSSFFSVSLYHFLFILGLHLLLNNRVHFNLSAYRTSISLTLFLSFFIIFFTLQPPCT